MMRVVVLLTLVVAYSRRVVRDEMPSHENHGMNELESDLLLRLIDSNFPLPSSSL